MEKQFSTGTPGQTVIERTPGIWSVEDADIVRSFVIAGSERALVIDTGMLGGDWKAVVALCTDLPYEVIHTHGHEDHVAGSGSFDRVWLHVSEHGLYKRYNGPETELLPLEVGQVFDLGGFRLKAVLLPGHSPGSVALVDEESKIIFAGDIATWKPMYMLSGDRDYEAVARSLRKLAGMVDDDTTVYTSHSYKGHPECTVTGKHILNVLSCVRGYLAGELEPSKMTVTMATGDFTGDYYSCGSGGMLILP